MFPPFPKYTQARPTEGTNKQHPFQSFCGRSNCQTISSTTSFSFAQPNPILPVLPSSSAPPTQQVLLSSKKTAQNRTSLYSESESILLERWNYFPLFEYSRFKNRYSKNGILLDRLLGSVGIVNNAEEGLIEAGFQPLPYNCR